MLQARFFTVPAEVAAVGAVAVDGISLFGKQSRGYTTSFLLHLKGVDS